MQWLIVLDGGLGRGLIGGAQAHSGHLGGYYREKKHFIGTKRKPFQGPRGTSWSMARWLVKLLGHFFSISTTTRYVHLVYIRLGRAP